jgi:hypothetical protein
MAEEAVGQLENINSRHYGDDWLVIAVDDRRGLTTYVVINGESCPRIVAPGPKKNSEENRA